MLGMAESNITGGRAPGVAAPFDFPHAQEHFIFSRVGFCHPSPLKPAGNLGFRRV